MFSVGYLFEGIGSLAAGSATTAGLVGSLAALYNLIKHGHPLGSEEGGISVPGSAAGTFGLNFVLGLPRVLREKRLGKYKVDKETLG